MELLLTVKIWHGRKNYIAYCPELEIASQGKNPEHALKRVKEAIECLLEETKKRGTLDEILEATGFVKKKKEWRSPLISLSLTEVKI